MKRFDPDATVIHTSIVETVGEPARLVRKLDNGQMIVEELIAVESSRLLCFRCLSHHVSLHKPDPGKIQLICYACGVRYGATAVNETEPT